MNINEICVYNGWLLIQYSGYELYGDKGKYYPNRVKQWLRYIQLQFPEAIALYETIKRMKFADDIVAELNRNKEHSDMAYSEKHQPIQNVIV